jgi:hypothetical protein
VGASQADLDLFCPTCRYNLRGLAGEWIRCPECGEKHERAELLRLDPDSITARRRYLQDSLEMACGGLVLGPLAIGLSLLGPPTLWLIVTLMSLIIVGATAVPAILELRRLCGPPERWRGPAAAYLLLTEALAAAVLAAPVGAIVVWLRCSAWFDGFGAAAVGVAVTTGLALAGVCLVLLRKLDALHRRRDERLETLLELAGLDARAKRDPSPDGTPPTA